MNKEVDALLERMHHADLAGIEMGLERVEQFLSLLGSPHKRVPPVIHVAGTNGKGSLLAYLNAIFEAAGYKVHRYTSPHLVTFNERIQIAGKPISDDYLLDILKRVVPFIDKQPVTFFESTTAAAFLAFSEQPADVVLLETGLGGRLDATNVVESPLLTALTPISIDHTDYLGDTLAAIATEKCGILKSGVPCVVGKQTKEVLELIKRKAKGANVPLSLYWKDWKVVSDGEDMRFRSAKHTMPLHPSMVGKHQFDNAATAIACIEQLPQFNVSDAHIKQGVSQATWPARLQKLDSGRLVDILPEGIELWLDGGHNAEGGEVLAAWLAQRNVPNVYLVCGMVEGKDSAAYLKPMSPLVKTLHSVTIDGEKTSQPAAKLQKTASGVGIQSFVSTDIENALQTIAQRAKTPAIVCICGSLYLAGKVLALNEK